MIMATDYCNQIIPLIDKMAKAGMIAPSDLELVHATDSVDDAIAHIRNHAIEPFGLRAARRVRPHWRWWEKPVYLRLSSHRAIYGRLAGAPEDLHPDRHSDRSQQMEDTR